MVFYTPDGLPGPALEAMEQTGRISLALSRMLNYVVQHCRVQAYIWPIDLTVLARCIVRYAPDIPGHTPFRGMVVVAHLPPHEGYSKPGFYSPPGHVCFVPFEVPCELQGVATLSLWAVMHAPVLRA